LVLAVETATQVCSVALGHSYEDCSELRTEQHGSHSEKLFEFIQNLLKQKSISVKDLQAVLVSAGPGSYTGLRIAASGLKGLLFGVKSEISLYAADTLAGFAYSALLEVGKNNNLPAGTKSTIHSVIDARRKHLYYRAFNIHIRENQPLLSLSNNQKAEVMELEKINTRIQPGDIVIGTGIERLDSDITSADTILTFGEKEITARSLIALYSRAVEHPQSTDAFKTYLAQTTPEKFNPRYVR